MYVCSPHLGGKMDNKSILNVQPPKFEWRVYRNDSTILTIAVVDQYDQPVDISSWTFTSKVREFPDSTSVLTTPIVATNGHFITLTLNTVPLERINYFDIQAFNDTTDQVKTILSGVIYLEEDVTR